MKSHELLIEISKVAFLNDSPTLIVHDIKKLILNYLTEKSDEQSKPV